MTGETKRSDDIGETPDPPQQHGLPSKSDAQLSASATTFSAKAKDLGALRDAVVDAAGVSAGLWLSYLLVLFYLAIAVGGVTHRDLLLENPLKLPILYVDVPLVGFFVLGPALFLIIHTYFYSILPCSQARSEHFTWNSRRRFPISTLARCCDGSCRATSSYNSSPDRAKFARASWVSCFGSSRR